MLRPHALQARLETSWLSPEEVTPGFVQAIFQLIAQVPTKYVQESIPSILDARSN